MQVDYIIVGQGLAGSWLSYYLIKEGASVLVFDAPAGMESASRAASGLMNPITGKRLARQPSADQLLPFAAGAYSEMSSVLNLPLAQEIPIHHFFGDADEATLFEKKANSTHADVLHPDSQIEGRDFFDAPFGTGTIYPATLIQLHSFLDGWRSHLKQMGALRESVFDWQAFSPQENRARYQDIETKAVLDCRGAAGATNPYFRSLPFALNKGEVLTATIPGLPQHAVYKHSRLAIVPGQDGRFWLGSSFDWNFQDTLPTDAFRKQAEAILKQWLRLPVAIEAHQAAIRPATVSRDAFAGLHPALPQLGILNGFGSKGCAWAPFLAHNLATHLQQGSPLWAQADVSRYARVLNR
ncbi:MAG: FAD-binding oxidoreductase [Bacteroidetes bacterium]|nr:FAD-binding oxidoreductase [Bacteroidota bacterium]